LTAIERAQLNALASLHARKMRGRRPGVSGRTYAGTAPQGTWIGYGTQALDMAVNGRTTELRGRGDPFSRRQRLHLTGGRRLADRLPRIR